MAEDDHRPNDRFDLEQLRAIADSTELDRATTAVEQIIERGYSRGRDLYAALQTYLDGSSH